jgi:hypothetical protein
MTSPKNPYDINGALQQHQDGKNYRHRFSSTCLWSCGAIALGVEIIGDVDR